MNRAFEYDSAKSESNNKKHGIGFEDAKLVWNDEFALVAPTKHVEGERRLIIVGIIAEKIWTVVYTLRADSIRIISARRARKEEVAYYEKNND